MNSKKVSVVILLGFISLSSCSKRPLKETAYLNKQDCAILSFKDNLSRDDFGFDENVTLDSVSDFSSIPETNRKYTLLLIDCSKYYSFMTKDAVESVYHWVHDSGSFRMASWYDAKDYSFLSEEPYSYIQEGEELYVCYSHYHFEEEGKVGFYSNAGGIINPLSIFSTEIKKHVETLY